MALSLFLFIFQLCDRRGVQRPALLRVVRISANKTVLKSRTDCSVAGKAALEREDLEPALKALKERLMTKNVAEEIAEKLCESVATSIVGRKQASFSLVSSTVKVSSCLLVLYWSYMLQNSEASFLKSGLLANAWQLGCWCLPRSAFVLGREGHQHGLNYSLLLLASSTPEKASAHPCRLPWKRLCCAS